MTNIIPIDTQKKIWRMYRSRFVIVLALMLLALSAVAALVLVPSYVALRVAAPPVVQNANTQNEAPVDESSALARSQALVRVLLPLAVSTTSPSEIITSAVSSRPRGVTVDHISYVSGAPGQITIGGNGSRESISAYRDILGKSGFFSSVSVPVGALVSQDGRFTISLSGDF
jgi:hypothetical protein